MATRTFLKIASSGLADEERTVETSAGAGDSGKIPNLNASGVLGHTVVNATVTSAGAGSSGQVVALDSTGRIDASAMPVGVVADVSTQTASEALGAATLVNEYSGGVRLADCSNGRQATGFVLSSVLNGGAASCYHEGQITGMSGLTKGTAYFLSTVGAVTATPTTTAGQILQFIGYATSTTSLNFEPETPVTRA